MPWEKERREESEYDEWRRRNSTNPISRMLQDNIDKFKDLGLDNKRTKDVHQVWDGGSDTFPDHNSDFGWRDETPSRNSLLFFTGESI